LKSEGKPPALCRTFESVLHDGAVSIIWQAAFPGKTELLRMQKDLDRDGLEYEQPALFFEVKCLGVKALSPEIKWIDWLEFDFGPNPNGAPSRTAKFEMPDGTEKEESVPSDGKLNLKKTLPGQVLFIGFK
jgi:hypothetical protein